MDLELPLLETDQSHRKRRLPPWLKRPLPTAGMAATSRIVAESGVATVCEEARCPNLTECWSRKTATFMIMGDKCTRRCHYCAVETAKPDPLSETEPMRMGKAAAALGLRHVVITAVARDDLADEGAGHYASCVRAVHEAVPGCTVEVLPADFHARPECIATLCEAEPEIYNHNLETVARLHPPIRPLGDYHRSLRVLRRVKETDPQIVTKSGLMAGLGETREELLTAIRNLRSAGCDVLTLGQYLQPSPKHAPVARYYPPKEFDELACEAEAMGFLAVAAGPFVRSSYNADLVFERVEKARRQGGDG
jgi:lipoic acid synthetase